MGLDNPRDSPAIRSISGHTLKVPCHLWPVSKRVSPGLSWSHEELLCDGQAKKGRASYLRPFTCQSPSRQVSNKVFLLKPILISRESREVRKEPYDKSLSQERERDEERELGLGPG